jgi:Xaa-Pro aminopeptidase
MLRIRLALLVSVCLAATAGKAISKAEYRSRRAELQKAVPDGIFVLFGRTEKAIGDDRTGFRQEPNFHYLTGWEEPGAILIVAPSREILFLPVRNEKSERYTGRKTAADDGNARDATGFQEVFPSVAFESELSKILEAHPKVYALAAETTAVKALAPLREVLDAQLPIARLRMKKSAAELDLIRRATLITQEAHRAAWERVLPGAFEYQAAAAFTAYLLEKGCPRNAYPPIAASGPNAIVLHYSKNGRRMGKGELLLLDAGAECSAYASDVTRTVPVGGSFTARQRELYEAVLGAQEAVIQAVRPGVTLGATHTSPGSLYKVAYDYLDSHRKDRHGKPLGQYLLHGVSHHVGLDVHDAAVPGQPLEAGMVITVEPGLYIPEEGIGIRIEDVVLVTENGAKVLSDRLPKDPGQIEKAMAK